MKSRSRPPPPLPFLAPRRSSRSPPRSAGSTSRFCARFLRKLEEATDALSHSRPGATPGEILEAGLDLLLAQSARRKGLVEKPRKTPRPAKPDHIPAHVRRAVWARDGHRCQWPLSSGGVCGSTRHLQLDHITPLALAAASSG